MMTGIADYEFVHQLGEGSHGSFWLARCPTRLGLGVDQVAVKTLLHNASDADFDRLAAELSLYASLSAPELVPLPPNSLREFEVVEAVEECAPPAAVLGQQASALECAAGLAPAP